MTTMLLAHRKIGSLHEQQLRSQNMDLIPNQTLRRAVRAFARAELRAAAYAWRHQYNIQNLEYRVAWVRYMKRNGCVMRRILIVIKLVGP